jgi:hypothetical protein
MLSLLCSAVKENAFWPVLIQYYESSRRSRGLLGQGTDLLKKLYIYKKPQIRANTESIMSCSSSFSYNWCTVMYAVHEFSRNKVRFINPS